MADERGLKSVLHHLLDNATKYAPEGDLILNADAENGIVSVSLSDSGPGIPSEERERVFEMFHRLDSSDAREVYGHGLGLPMARRLLEAMGGGIRAEPTEHNGARIIFWLPEAEAA
jgi:signal transduction histidine kinase